MMPELLFAKDVSFAYAETGVLHGVSLVIRGGEVTALTGHNGSGKSTLLELFARVLKPDEGTISAHGDVALVVQRPSAPTALPLSVHDVVAIGTWRRGGNMRSAQTRAAVEHALERVGMAEFARASFASLSGGQRQRVCVAQGIVRSPSVLLLDEPAAGLDQASMVRTQKILREEAERGAVVVCVTHHAEQIAVADRVISLQEGRVLE